MTFLPRSGFAAAMLDGGGFGHNVFNPGYAGGAVGDGVTDDGPAFQAAIDAAAVDGRPVLVPGGAYLIGDTLDVPSNVAILGANIRVATGNAPGTVLLRGFSGTLLDFAGTSETHRSGQRLDGVLIEGQEAEAYTGTAIDISFTSGFRSADVEVHGNIGRAWRCVETWDALIERPWMRRCGAAGTAPAIEVANTDDETSDTVVFSYPHWESNYATHLHVHAPGAFAFAPRWVKLIEPKVHGFPTAEPNITEPLVEIEDSEDFVSIGGQYQGNGDTGGTLRVGGTRPRVIGARIGGDGTTDATSPLVLLANCSRGYFVVSLGSTSSPQKVFMVTGSSNNRVVLTASDGAAPTGPLDNGTDNVTTSEQDGFLHLLSGSLRVGSSPPSAGIVRIGFGDAVVEGSLGVSASAGAARASAGDIRLRNNGSIQARNAANDGNVNAVSVDTSDRVQLKGGDVVIDSDATSGQTRMFLYDGAAAGTQRIKVGANGTGPGGTGRALYFDNV